MLKKLNFYILIITGLLGTTIACDLNVENIYRHAEELQDIAKCKNVEFIYKNVRYKTTLMVVNSDLQSSFACHDSVPSNVTLDISMDGDQLFVCVLQEDNNFAFLSNVQKRTSNQAPITVARLALEKQ